MYDCKKFTIINVIVLLCGGKGFREIDTGMEVPVGVLLHEHATKGSKGGVSHDKERFGKVGECQDRLFQEGFLMVDRPLPLGIFVGEGEQRFGKVGESRYEFLIEIAESNERSDCFYIDGGSNPRWP